MKSPLSVGLGGPWRLLLLNEDVESRQRKREESPPFANRYPFLEKPFSIGGEVFVVETGLRHDFGYGDLFATAEDAEDPFLVFTHRRPDFVVGVNPELVVELI